MLLEKEDALTLQSKDYDLADVGDSIEEDAIYLLSLGLIDVLFFSSSTSSNVV